MKNTVMPAGKCSLVPYCLTFVGKGKAEMGLKKSDPQSMSLNMCGVTVPLRVLRPCTEQGIWFLEHRH